MHLTDADLFARLRNFEDHLVERKTVKDEKDWKKTAVAFANSAPVGVPAVLFIGVKDTGEIETPQANLDEIQKKFNVRMRTVYPRVAYVTKILSENGKEVLAVLVPGSASRPHFAGLAYVRKGSESMDASEEQFAELISQRNGKAGHLLAWKGRGVTVVQRNPVQSGLYFTENAWGNDVTVADCNQFYVTFGIPNGTRLSFPLSRVQISFDNEKKRLKIETTG